MTWVEEPSWMGDGQMVCAKCQSVIYEDEWVWRSPDGDEYHDDETICADQEAYL